MKKNQKSDDTSIGKNMRKKDISEIKKKPEEHESTRYLKRK